MTNKVARLVIQSGNVFDSLTGKINKDYTVVIEDKKISWIGKNSSFDKEKNDNVINVSEKFVLPGLVECHVHLDGSGTTQEEREFMRTKSSMWPYIALANAQKHLMSGFTCVRDCGSFPDFAPSLRRIFDQGLIAGPRLLVSNRVLMQPGNKEYVGPDVLFKFLREYFEIKSGVDGVIHGVRERKWQGSDFIKTMTSGGVLHGIESKLEHSLWTEEELEALVKEAHRMDMHIACHAHGREGIYQAAKAGIDTIEHGSQLDEETADIMIKKGLYLIPTQAALINLNKPEINKQMPPEVRKKISEAAEISLENHRMAFKKGVPIALGTDAGTPGNFHGETAQEIRYMIENVGMNTTQALQTATIEGARAIKLEDKIGSIEQGKIADIIICEKNPITDISVLENPKKITHVIKDGIIMAQKGNLTYFPK
ncbi:MAG: amidohydrolase family protein [Asgard group archaeon]|nr:amidohydrolase family protein [Asgard group archaeon]